MKVSELVNILENKSYQNATPIFYTQREIISDINNWLDFIFNNLNSRLRWYYAIETEKFDTNWQKLFDLSYDIHDFYEVSNDNIDLKYRTVLIEKDDKNQEEFWIVWTRQIKTTEEQKKLKVVYLRWPKRCSVWGLDEEIDLPEALIWVLELYVMSRILMPMPDGWRNLANNDMQYAQTWLDNYANSIGKLSNMEWFSPKQYENGQH